MIQREQCNPKKRIALFSCAIENNVYVIHMVDIITPYISTSKPQLFDRRLHMRALDDCFKDALALYNHDLLEPLRIIKTVELSKESVPTQFSYHCEHLKLSLPADQIRFLGALGAMDSFIHLLVQITQTLGYVPIIKFMEQIPELNSSNVERILANLVAYNPHNSYSEEQPLSHLFSQYIVNLALQNKNLLQPYLNIISFLQELNSKTEGSLASLIRMKLYPNKAASKFIASLEKLINTEQGLVVYLLDPEVDLAKKATKTVAYMRTDLSRYYGEEKRGLKQAYENLFIEFEVQKQYLWFAMLKDIYGRPGFDGVPLHDRCTEIILLKQSKFVLNTQGLLVIQFIETDPYRNYYAPNKINHDKIHEELTLLFKYLGFTIEPGQNFHSTAGITLSRQTTQDLLSYGFHYSKAYVKDLLRISHAVWRAESMKYGHFVFKKIKRCGVKKELLTAIFAKITKEPVLLEDIMTLAHTPNTLPKKKEDPSHRRQSPSRK